MGKNWISIKSVVDFRKLEDIITRFDTATIKKNIETLNWIWIKSVDDLRKLKDIILNHRTKRTIIETLNEVWIKSADDLRKLKYIIEYGDSETIKTLNWIWIKTADELRKLKDIILNHSTKRTIIETLNEAWIKSVDDLRKLKDIIAYGDNETTKTIIEAWIKSADELRKLKDFIRCGNSEIIKTNIKTLNWIWIKTAVDLRKLKDIITYYDTAKIRKNIETLNGIWIKSAVDLLKLKDIILNYRTERIKTIIETLNWIWIKRADDLRKLKSIIISDGNSETIKRNIETLNWIWIKRADDLLKLKDIIINYGDSETIKRNIEALNEIWIKSRDDLLELKRTIVYGSTDTIKNNISFIFKYFSKSLPKPKKYINLLKLNYKLSNINFWEQNHLWYLKYIDEIISYGFDDEKKCKMIEKICGLQLDKVPNYLKVFRMIDISIDVQWIKNELINKILNPENPLSFEQLCNDENISEEEIVGILCIDYGLNKNFNELNFQDKIIILTNYMSIEKKTLIYLKKYGIDKNKVDTLVDEISLELWLKKESIHTTEENKKALFSNFIRNNPTIEEIVKSIDFTKYKDKDGIPLKYPRSEFIKDIDNILQNLNPEDKVTVLNYFSMEIKDNKMEWFPIIPRDLPVVKAELVPIIEQLKKIIIDFTQNNETIVADPKLKQLLDSVIKGCPEFTTIIGKNQHEKHKYSVDIHTLKVLQNVFNDPEYQKLDNESKTVLKFSVLLHDIGKKEGIKDEWHYETSAKYAVSILGKYNLSARVKSRIIETIYNHHRFEQYNKNKISANFVNAIFRTPNDLKIGMLMAKADLMGVGYDFHFEITETHNIDEFNDFFAKKTDELIIQQHARYRNSNLVVDTKFNQTDKRKFPTETVMIKGKMQKIPVLNLTDENLPEDLFEFGFSKGVNRKNARFFAHFNDRIKGLKVFIALSSSPTTESVQSLTMISLNNSRSYRNQTYGVITDVDMANIAQASNANIWSGYKKNLVNFSKGLFDPILERTFVRDCLIEELDKASINLTKEEYAQLAEKIVDIQYETQITQDIKIGDKTIPSKVLQDALKTSRDKLFNEGQHNEIVAINPRVKALVARVSSIEECSQEFLELAIENNLPIILIGNSK